MTDEGQEVISGLIGSDNTYKVTVNVVNYYNPKFKFGELITYGRRRVGLLECFFATISTELSSFTKGRCWVNRRLFGGCYKNSSSLSPDFRRVETITGCKPIDSTATELLSSFECGRDSSIGRSFRILS